MGKNRLEAFSDGVIAIIITIMVLELKVPHGADFKVLLPLWPVFLSYVLSFIYIGIYWNNHHHMLHAVHEINGDVLWANLHLLFWLSLIPFVTGWMGENHFETLPVAAYGVVLFMCAIAYSLLARRLISHHGKNAVLAEAIGNDRKGKISIMLYLVGIGLSFVYSWLGFVAYICVAIIWLVPDRRIEDRMAQPR
ncbi:MAG: TMEM175 family protein [Massilia sp.]